MPSLDMFDVMHGYHHLSSHEIYVKNYRNNLYAVNIFKYLGFIFFVNNPED